MSSRWSTRATESSSRRRPSPKTPRGTLATALLRAYPTAAGFHGVPVRRVAAVRYDGRHKVGAELAGALIAAAAGSVGRHHGEVYRVQVRYTCEGLEVLRRRLRELERDIDRLLEQHEIGRLLTTIDGIGPQTAARLVATFGDFSSFPSAGALASYVGAVPALKQSGKRAFQRASLTLIGAARLRAKLWMPVLTAVRTNPWLRAYYERLIAPSCPRSRWWPRCGSCCTPSTAWPLIVDRSWPISSPRRPAMMDVTVSHNPKVAGSNPAPATSENGALANKLTRRCRFRSDPLRRRSHTSGEITMTTGPTLTLMKQINEAFNSRDVDRIMSFFAEDCTFLMARGPEPEGRRVHGKAAVRNVLGDRFGVITDMRWDHVDSFITGNRAVTVWIVTGTGVDGEKLNHRGCDLYEFRGDKILNKDTYWKLVEHRDRL